MQTLRMILILFSVTALSPCFPSPVRAQAFGEDDEPAPPEEGDETPLTPEDQARAALQEGKRLYDSRSFVKALKSFSDVLRLEPANRIALFYRGVIRIQLGKYEAAHQDFQPLIETYEKAEAEAKKAQTPLTAHRRFAAKVYAMRGKTRMVLNQWTGALADLKKALALEPAMMKMIYRVERDIAQTQALADAKAKIWTGRPAPPVKLVGASGVTFDSGSCLGKAYLVLLFYITWKSPVCRDQISQYNELLPEFAKRGATVAAVSTDRLKFGIELRENKGLTLRLLADEKGEVVKAYGLVNLRHAKTPEAIPAVLLLDRSGKVVYSCVSLDPRHRAEPGNLLKVLDGLIKEKRQEKPGGEGKPGTGN